VIIVFGKCCVCLIILIRVSDISNIVGFRTYVVTNTARLSR
jgi:hypothetical protein